MNPLDTPNVINFIDEVNKQHSYDKAMDNVNNDPSIKLRRLNDTKKQGVDTCMNHILSKICSNAIPEVNGRVANTPDLDKFVSDYIDKRSGGKGIEFYVKEAIRRNPKNTAVIKHIYESVEKIVNEEYTDKVINPDSITEEDYEFKITNDMDEKLSSVIRDNNLDDLAEVIKDNVRNTAVTEVELAKKEKEERLALEEELTNDDSITTEAALEEALKERGIGRDVSVYTPSLFEAVMISKFNSMEAPSVIGDTEFAVPDYFVEGVLSAIKSKLKIKLGETPKETIAKNHPTFLANIESAYKQVYSEYRKSIVPINVKKMVDMYNHVHASGVLKDGYEFRFPIDPDVFKDRVDTYKEKMKSLIDEKKTEVVSTTLPGYACSMDVAIKKMKKYVSELDTFFEKPDVKSYVNKASSYVTPKVNKCETSKDVHAVYNIVDNYYINELSYRMFTVTFCSFVFEVIKELSDKADNVAAKESAFDEAVTEYTLLSISKALYLESFGLMDIDHITKEYAKM